MDEKMNGQKLNPVQLMAYMVIIAAGMYAVASILSLVLLALLLAISLMPLIYWLMKHRIPKWLAITLTIFLFLIAIVIINTTIAAAVYGISEKLPQYRQDLYELKIQALNLAKNAGIEIPEQLAENKVDVNAVVSYAREFISAIVSVFSNFVLVFLLIVFLVIDVATLRQRFEKGEFAKDSAMIKLIDLAGAIRKYVSIAAWTGLLTAAGNLVLLLVLGVEYPVLWAFLSFLFSFIPNIGFLLSVIAPAFLALVGLGPASAVMVVLGFIVINGIVENIIKPRVMGQELEMSLSIVFLSLIGWAFLLGPIGTVLAIPMSIAVKMGWDVYVRG
jgi:AI-2 transport protein TqsA